MRGGWMGLVLGLPLLALMAMPSSGAQAFEADLDQAAFMRAAGKKLVGDLAPGDLAAVALNWGWLCRDGKNLVMPADTVVDSEVDSEEPITVRVEPDRSLVIETPKVKLRDSWHWIDFSFPTCQDLKESGYIADGGYRPVKSIDGATSLSAWAAVLASRP